MLVTASLLVVLAAPLLSAAPPHVAASLPAPRTLDKTSKKIDAFLTDSSAFGWSGTVHLQRGNKKVFSGAYGLADDESGRPCEVDTLYEIGSLTQSLTVTAVLALVDEGKLGLAEPLSSYVAEAPDYATKITVAHLCQGTSGFAGGVSVKADASREDALVKLLSRAPKSPAGEVHKAWDDGFIFLAGIVEQASGKSFEAYLQEAIFEPSKAGPAAFVGGEVDPALEAVGYERGKPRRASKSPFGSYGWNYRGAGGLVTSAPELAKVLVALQAAKLLKKETLAVMARRGPDDHGLGWGIDRDYHASCDRLEAGGETQGFRSFASVNLGTQLVTVVLSNRSDCPARFMDTIVRDIASGEKLLTKQSFYPPETVKWSAKDLDALVGTWVDGEGSELELTRYGNRSLAAEAYRFSLAAGTSETKRAVFAPIAKRELVNHSWTPGAKVSQLVWNGKRGGKGELTLTDPSGKKWVLHPEG
jgi:CubicO group peptidase (beta-lactamase class C family)